VLIWAAEDSGYLRARGRSSVISAAGVLLCSATYVSNFQPARKAGGR